LAFSPAGDVRCRDERLAAREGEVASLQKQLGLASVQLRSAQRAVAAADGARATALGTLEQKAEEMGRLEQLLGEAQVGGWREGWWGREINT
jgi:hypothetical protein